MYDDLARAQRPSALEWLVVNALIPSVLFTVVLRLLWLHTAAPSAQPPSLLGPDPFPVLITMPEPAYPPVLRRARAEDHVLLRALVTPDGRVDSASILTLQDIYPAFAASAHQALSHARFQPARFGGTTGAAWVTIMIDFTLTRATR